MCSTPSCLNVSANRMTPSNIKEVCKRTESTLNAEHILLFDEFIE